MDISKPILTEPGVKYFLKETLKNCKIKKDTEFNKIINFKFKHIKPNTESDVGEIKQFEAPIHHSNVKLI